MAADPPVIAEIDVDPTRMRLYAEGWQSWTPARVLAAREACCCDDSR